MKKPIRPCLCLLILSMTLLSGGLLQAAQWEGRKVVAVRQKAEDALVQPLPPAVFDETVLIHAGDAYDASLVSQSIERLFATGRFEDIRVDAAADSGGVILTFLTRSRYFVGLVHVLGVPGPPSEAQLRAASELRLGLAFIEEDLPEAEERILNLLRDDGYFQASLTVRLERRPEAQQVNVYFDVVAGERARIGRLSVLGNPVFPFLRLLARSNWDPDKQFDSRRIQDGLRRLRELYRDEDYLEASIALAGRTYHPDTNRVDLELAVEAGRPVEIAVTGAEISRFRLRQLVPLYQEGVLDEDLLLEGQRNLRNYFEVQGYFDVEVGMVRSGSSDGRERIEYQVNPGQRQRVDGIEITGNGYFGEQVIRERMSIRTSSYFGRYGRFSRSALARDVASIRALYSSNGFSEVVVDASIRNLGAGSRGGIVVRIDIQEGAQILIGDFAIAGNETVPESALRNYINADTGQPYSDSLVASDRNHLLTFYLNEGFPSPRFRAETVPSGDGLEVALQYIIEEGRQAYIRGVHVEGLENTRPGILQRQMQFEPGQPLSQGRLLDTQRRLYDLGIFSRVDVAVQNPRVPEFEPNVLLYVEEARRHTVRIGLGGEVGRFGGGGPEGNLQFSPDVSLDVSRLNFGGRPHTFGFRTRFSSLQKRGGLIYTAPRLLNNESLTGTAFAFFDKTQDVETFTASRWEASVQLDSRRDRATTFISRYAFRRVRLDEDSVRISEDQIPLVSRSVLVGLLGLTWLRDTRDVPTNAERGLFSSIDLAVAANQLGSETSFLRGFVQNSSYHRLIGGLILARTTQFGVQTPFGEKRLISPENANEVATRAIPISERFYSGGGSSHRGFGLNQAGPRDLETGFVVGGNALLLNSAELRFPIWRSISGATFHDAGNVFASIRDVSFRQHQRSSTDFNYISHGVGMGIRYVTPVGPMRLDVGYSLNPTRFRFFEIVEQDGQNVRNDVSSSLSRWQFLFSVGQTF